MFAGIDIGGTSIKFGIVSDCGDIIFQGSKPTDAVRGKDSMLDDIANVVKSFFNEHTEVKSIGVGFPSVVNPHDGCVYYPPNLPGWDVVPLLEILQSHSTVPVAIDNDANVAALAESKLGAGKNHSHFLYVTLGTGVGGGIIVNNSIFNGEFGGAGEIGHIIVDVNNDPTNEQLLKGRAYRAGTLEEFLGRSGIIRIAKDIADKHPTSLLHTDIENLDVEEISQAVYKEDLAAIECFKHCGKILGLGIASILAVLDMRVVVVGGGISQSHPMFLETTLQTIQQRALPTIAKSAQVKLAHFSYNAGIVGAAMLGKQKIYKGEF